MSEELKQPLIVKLESPKPAPVSKLLSTPEKPEDEIVKVLKDIEKNDIVLAGHTKKVFCVTISTTGNYIISGSRDRTIKL